MLSSTSENLACTDEVKVYEDEGEEEEQQNSSENLTEDKVRLVIESETQIPRIFDFFSKNGTAPSLFKIPTFLTDPRLASYFLPGYPAAIVAAMAAVNAASVSSPSSTSNHPASYSANRTTIDPSSTSSWSNSVPHPPPPAHSSFWSHPGGAGGGGGSSSCSSSGYASSEGSVGTNGWFHAAHSPATFNFQQYYYPHYAGNKTNFPMPRSMQALLPDSVRTDSRHQKGCRSSVEDNVDSHLPPYINPALMPFYNRFAAMAAAAAAYSSSQRQHHVAEPPNPAAKPLRMPSTIFDPNSHSVNGKDPRSPVEGNRRDSSTRPRWLNNANQSSDDASFATPVTSNEIESDTRYKGVATFVSSRANSLPSAVPAHAVSPVNSPATPNNFYAACAAAMAAAAVASWNGSPQTNSSSTPHRKSPISAPSPARSRTPSSSPTRSNLAAAAAVVAALSPAAAALYQRRDSCRTSVATTSSSNSAVASPYSPSMFAAAAAAHMQLLSAAVASFSSGQIPSGANTSSTMATASATTTTLSHSNVVVSSEASNDSTDHQNWSGQGSNVQSQTDKRSSVMDTSSWIRRGSLWSNRSRGARSNSFNSTRQFNGSHGSSSPMRGEGITRGVGRRGHACAKSMHIKKPLNAFMLFMKEMRTRVQEECTLKESAAINQVLGKKWHELSREEQTKYYEMARKEKELHQQMYPNWSARDNYAYHARRRKRRRHLLHRHILHPRSRRHSSKIEVERIGTSFNHTLAELGASKSQSVRSSPIHTNQDGSNRSLSPISTNSASLFLSRRYIGTSPRSPPSRASHKNSPSVLVGDKGDGGVEVGQTGQEQNSDIRDSRNPPESGMKRCSQEMGDLLRSLPNSLSAFSLEPTHRVGFIQPSSGVTPEDLSTTLCSKEFKGSRDDIYQKAKEHFNFQSEHPSIPFNPARRISSPVPHREFPSNFALPYPSCRHPGQYTNLGRSQSVIPRAPFLQRAHQSFPPMPPHMNGTDIFGRSTPHQRASQMTNFSVSSSPNSVAAVAAAAAVAMAASELTGGSLKKCRARFGLEHQNMWCKPCRRKKKCIRFISDNDVDEFPLNPSHRPSTYGSMDNPGFRMPRPGLSNFIEPLGSASAFQTSMTRPFQPHPYWNGTTGLRFRNTFPEDLRSWNPPPCAPQFGGEFGALYSRFPQMRMRMRLPLQTSRIPPSNGSFHHPEQRKCSANFDNLNHEPTGKNKSFEWPSHQMRPLKAPPEQFEDPSSFAGDNFVKQDAPSTNYLSSGVNNDRFSGQTPSSVTNKPQLKRLTDMCVNLSNTKRSCSISPPHLGDRQDVVQSPRLQTDSMRTTETVRFGVADVLMSKNKAFPCGIDSISHEPCKLDDTSHPQSVEPEKAAVL